MSISRTLGMAGLSALVCACGGGGGGGNDDGSSGRAAYTIAAVSTAVDGTENELALDDPDAVLAAALAAITTASAATSGDLADLDDGADPPGRGLFACSAGSISESVAQNAVSGERRVVLSTSQCFDGRSDGVQNGAVELRYTQPAAGQAVGTIGFGDGGAPFTYVLPDTDDVDYVFRQARGSFAFEGEFDGSPSQARASGWSLVIGKGPRPFGSAAFVPDRQIEVLAGAPGFELETDSSRSNDTESLGFSGRLFIAGTGAGLDPACAFAARFDALSNRPLEIGVDDEIVRGGLLTLSTSLGSATVEFDAAGNAQVDLGTGTPQTYPASAVRSFCKL